MNLKFKENLKKYLNIRKADSDYKFNFDDINLINDELTASLIEIWK